MLVRDKAVDRGQQCEKKEAASMTPAENPSNASCSGSEILRMKRIGSAPTPVASPAAALAPKPINISDQSTESTMPPATSRITCRPTHDKLARGNGL
jgi:hypothetical protein